MPSHLNWVETLIRQWCTAIWALPATRYYSGLLPKAIQIWAENESNSITVWMADGLINVIEILKLFMLSQAALCFITKSTWGQGERWWSAERSSLARNGDITPSNTATHVDTCMQTCTHSDTLLDNTTQHACKRIHCGLIIMCKQMNDTMWFSL